MYKPFLIFSIISTFLGICLLAGSVYHFRVLANNWVYAIISIYFIVTMLVLLFTLIQDKGIIFTKRYGFRNTILYFFTTPLPLLVYVILSVYLLKLSDKFYFYRSISDFKICENCLGEDESIRVIYESGSPSINNNLDFYVHRIVINSDGDTVNILSINPYSLASSENELVFSKTSLKVIENYDSLYLKPNINNLKIQKIEKVALDFKDIFKNYYLRYNTVIGEVDEVIKTSE